MLAAECGHGDMVTLLLKHNANVFCSSKTGDTALGLVLKAVDWSIPSAHKVPADDAEADATEVEWPVSPKRCCHHPALAGSSLTDCLWLQEAYARVALLLTRQAVKVAAVFDTPDACAHAIYRCLSCLAPF